MSDDGGPGGLIQAIGNGVVGLIEQAFDTIGGVLRGMVGDAQSTVPTPILIVIVIAVLLLAAWTLARR